MTWRKYVHLWCDGDGCNKWVDTGEPNVRRAESYAKGEGWRIAGYGEHYCPDCR